MKKKRSWGLRASLAALLAGPALAAPALADPHPAPPIFGAPLETTNSPYSQAFNKEAAKATMSKETRALLGKKWADRITEWSGMNILVLSERDVKNANIVALGKTKEQLVKAKADYLKDRYPTLKLGQLSDAHLADMFDFAKTGTPVSLNFSTDNSTTLNQCIVTMPGENWSKEFYFATLAGLDEKQVSNIPGTREIWQTLVMIHEARHCVQDEENIMRSPSMLITEDARFKALLREEINADQYTIHVIEKLLKQGHKDFKGMSEALIHARSIGVFNRMIEPHISGGVLQKDGAITAVPYDAEDIIMGALKPMILIYGEVGQNHVDEIDQAYVMVMYMQTSGLGKHDLFIPLYKAYFNSDKDAITTIMTQLEADLGKEKMDEYRLMFAVYTVEVGLIAINMDSKNFYTVAQRQLDDGVYKDDPLSEIYIERAIEGYKKHAPERIGLSQANDNKPNGTASGEKKQVKKMFPWLKRAYPS